METALSNVECNIYVENSTQLSETEIHVVKLPLFPRAFECDLIFTKGTRKHNNSKIFEFSRKNTSTKRKRLFICKHKK